MVVNIELSRIRACFYQKGQNSIKGNVNVDVYMYYQCRGLFHLFIFCTRTALKTLSFVSKEQTIVNKHGGLGVDILYDGKKTQEKA